MVHLIFLAVNFAPLLLCPLHLCTFAPWALAPLHLCTFVPLPFAHLHLCTFAPWHLGSGGVDGWWGWWVVVGGGGGRWSVVVVVSEPGNCEAINPKGRASFHYVEKAMFEFIFLTMKVKVLY